MWTSFCWDLALASNSCIVFHAGWIPTFCGALRLRLRADRTLSHALVVLYTVCWTTISMDPNLSSNLVDHIFAVKVHVDNLSPGRSCLICLLVVSISYFHMTHDIYTVHTCIYIYIYVIYFCWRRRLEPTRWHITSMTACILAHVTVTVFMDMELSVE